MSKLEYDGEKITDCSGNKTILEHAHLLVFSISDTIFSTPSEVLGKSSFPSPFLSVFAGIQCPERHSKPLLQFAGRIAVHAPVEFGRFCISSSSILCNQVIAETRKAHLYIFVLRLDHRTQQQLSLHPRSGSMPHLSAESISGILDKVRTCAVGFSCGPEDLYHAATSWLTTCVLQRQR